MSTIGTQFEINGVIDTNQSVMSNLNTLCTAANCWMTFDVNTGLWSVIINKPGSSIKHFDDTNIIGNITVSGTGINEYYNSVSVEFPHVDLRDTTDYIDLEIPAEDRFPNEQDNNLNITLQCINNPIQAQYIGTIELKQSRVDKVIQFRTDYTSVGLRAGDLIDISASMYGFTNKVFRITKITEEDAEDGTIQLAITALEYDANVYDTSGLIRTERNKKTGIVPKSQNAALSASDMQALSSKLKVQPVLFTFFNNLITLNETLSSDFLTASMSDPRNRYNTTFYYTIPITSVYKVKYLLNWGGTTISPAPGSGDYYESPESVMKGVQILLRVNGVWNPRSQSYTGDQRVQLLEDHYLEDYVYLNKGDQVEFWVNAICNYGPNHPFAAGLAASSGFRVSGELLLCSAVTL